MGRRAGIALSSFGLIFSLSGMGAIQTMVSIIASPPASDPLGAALGAGIALFIGLVSALLSAALYGAAYWTTRALTSRVVGVFMAAGGIAWLLSSVLTAQAIVRWYVGSLEGMLPLWGIAAILFAMGLLLLLGGLRRLRPTTR